jgi:hypothetical protein
MRRGWLIGLVVGLILAGAALSQATITRVFWSAIQGKPTTIAGYGIVDATQLGNTPQTTVTSTQTLAATLRGRVVRCDTGSGVVVLTLPTSPTTGDWLITSKSTSDTNRCSIQVSGSDIAWLSRQHDDVLWQFNGSAWVARWVDIAPLAETITTSGTWTKPPLAQNHTIYQVGGGGGGGSGRVSATSVNAFGGGAGGTATFNREFFVASELPATVTVTIAAGGTAGAAVSTGSTSGNSGGTGGNTTFGTSGQAWYRVARGGNGAGGGTNTAGVSGGFWFGTWFDAVNAPSANMTVPQVQNSFVSLAGAGGGVTNANAQTAGNIANFGNLNIGNTGTAGGTACNAGANAVAATPLPAGFLNQTAPSGGGGCLAGAAGKGGDADTAGVYGLGGAGGGGTRDGQTSGAGGRGAPGVIVIVTSF